MEIEKILLKYSKLNCSVSIGNNNEILPNIDVIKAVAGSIKRLGNQDPLACFRFCVLSDRTRAGCPFFPTSYADPHYMHFKGSAQLAIGLETGTLLAHVLEKSESITDFSNKFKDAYSETLMSVDSAVTKIISKLNIEAIFDYIGIDASLNPSADCFQNPDISMGHSLNCLMKLMMQGNRNFGANNCGSMAVCYLITEAIQMAIKKSGIKTTGYNGLMLPVLEDSGLVNLDLSISKLLQFSAVCGVGIDTIPIAGKFEENELSMIVLDMLALSFKWNKQLSCRVLPVRGKTAGEMSEFVSPYLVNSKIFDLN